MTQTFYVCLLVNVKEGGLVSFLCSLIKTTMFKTIIKFNNNYMSSENDTSILWLFIS